MVESPHHCLAAIPGRVSVNPAMRATNVVELYRAMIGLDIDLWIDGGWGVDALVGEQTRPHADLDIAIEERHVARLRDWLVERGYRDLARDDTSPWNFVLGDDRGRQIDVHVIVLDTRGNGIYGPPERGEMYPAAALTGRGAIAGWRVRCISAEWLVKFHSGYAPRASDDHDVDLLCRRFGIAYPEEYRHLRERG
jgi:lincosamide nucleotidyltransferase A/C/D/E